MPPCEGTALPDAGVEGLVDPVAALSTCNPITLKFVDVGYTIKIEPTTGIKSLLCSSTIHTAEPKEKNILSNITGMVSPGEFVAILGPSGSGKSTLLSILGGRNRLKHTGTVLANDNKLTGSAVRRIGFVAQDDIMYPHLTVRETLVFCALLRLPKTLTKAEKVEVAEGVMEELGLGKCCDTVVGNAFVRGVSGGERRRVSIGHEMLVNPSFMLLDEPTSGLDSTAAHRIVATLVGLARKGKGVVASLHQPSSAVFQMFDKVLLLSEGRCIYFGDGQDAMAYFASAGFSPRFPVNPADFMLDLANGIVQGEEQGDMGRANTRQDLITCYNRLLAPRVKTMIANKPLVDKHPTGDVVQKDCSNIGWINQFSILLQRSIKERRHETFDSLRVFQVLATAVLGGMMWWHSDIHNVPDRAGLLFFISVIWGVLPSFNAVFTFPQERAMLAKERSSGMYTLSSYFMARMIGDLPMELTMPIAFTITTYWMAGLLPNLVVFILTMLVILAYVLVAHGVGLAFGALIMDAKKAATAVTITMLAFVLIGGFYVQKVPACLRWMRYTSCTFYCYELLIRVQYSGRETALLQGTNIGMHVGVVTSVWVLLGMFVGFRVLAYLLLRRVKM